MPLHSSTITAARMPRSARLAAIAATAVTAGAFAIALAENGPAPQVRSISESAQPAASRFFDLEANKVAGMRALGEQSTVSGTEHVSRYEDLEGNRAGSRRAH